MMNYRFKTFKNIQLSIIAVVISFTLVMPGIAHAIDDDLVRKGIVNYDPNSGSICGGSAGAGIATETLTEFIDAYGQSAFNIGKQYGIPYEAILSQSALESGYGKSKLTTEAYNFFGIKAGPGWTGPVYTAQTQEQLENGSYVTETASFRAYSSAQEGFRGYADFITSNPRYEKALSYPQDPVAYITEVRAAGYATDQAYVQKNVALIEAIKKYIAEKNLFPPSSAVTPDVSRPVIETDGSSNQCSTSTPGTGKIADVIRIAEAENAKNVVESPRGSNGGAAVSIYTDGNREPWCADFTSWVFNQAGIPFTGGTSGGWRIPRVIDLQAWFQNGTNGSEYFRVGEKTPQPGDVAFYIGKQTPDGGSDSHVNIVISVNGNTMTTIGGNESDRISKGTRKIELGANSLVGFGRVAQ